jgi:hypothetical protein
MNIQSEIHIVSEEPPRSFYESATAEFSFSKHLVLLFDS